LREAKTNFPVGSMRDTVKLVTFWGVTDTDSWRRNGRPLLFDGNWQPKPAFKVVIDQAGKLPGGKN